jgi:hypothetical protein
LSLTSVINLKGLLGVEMHITMPIEWEVIQSLVIMVLRYKNLFQLEWYIGISLKGTPLGLKVILLDDNSM